MSKTFLLTRAVTAVLAAGCSSSGATGDDGSSLATNLPACAPTLAGYCREAGALCATTWDTARSLVDAPECAGGLYLYACNGLDVASCPGDEGGGHTFAYDPSSHLLVAVVAYPSVISGGNAGCYVGAASLRALLEDGPPNCPMGSLLGTGDVAGDASE